MTRAEKLAALDAEIAAIRDGDTSIVTIPDARRWLVILQAIAEDYRRPAVTFGKVLQAIDEKLGYDAIYADGEMPEITITGVATAAEAIMELIGQLGRLDAAASREGPGPDGWRPIEDAPKDGSWIIVLSMDGCNVERISWGRSIRGHDAWMSATALVSYDLSGAWCGWMPCPARPEMEGK